VCYGELPISLSQQIYHLFIEVLAPAPAFWLILLVTPFACVLPGFFVRQVCRCPFVSRSTCMPVQPLHAFLVSVWLARDCHVTACMRCLYVQLAWPVLKERPPKPLHAGGCTQTMAELWRR
jgi:hypothetical protein